MRTERLPQGSSVVTAAPPPVVAPISERSARMLPPTLLTALRELRTAAADNNLPVREVYAYAYHAAFTRDPVVRDREQRAIRDDLARRGYDVTKLLSEGGVRSYAIAVQRAHRHAVTKDLPGTQLARTGYEAFHERAFLNCLDYAKATAYLAYRRDPTIELRFFVVMDAAGYATMCPHGPDESPAGPQRPVVHTMVAYKKDGSWWVVSPEMDLGKSDLEIWHLGPQLPARLGPHFRIQDAPFVRGKDMVYAGSYGFIDPRIGGPVHPQTLKNITASGSPKTTASAYVCR